MMLVVVVVVVNNERLNVERLCARARVSGGGGGDVEREDETHAAASAALARATSEIIKCDALCDSQRRRGANDSLFFTVDVDAAEYPALISLQCDGGDAQQPWREWRRGRK